MPSISSMLSASSGRSVAGSSATKSSRCASRLAIASICACGMASVLDRKASASVSPITLMWPSWALPWMPTSVMPWRSRCSRRGRSWITWARSLRLGLALAAQTSSEARGLEREGVLVLRAVAHRRQRQHLGPDLEQELADLLAHRHVGEHAAQLDRVLDRQRLLLLDLLRHADHALRRCAVGEEARQEFLELVVDQLEHAPAGLRVLLDHLDHALDLDLQRAAADRGGVEAHHAGAHAVDQLARRVLERAEELRLGDRHAQHRHLQPREPDAHGRRNALFGQDALEHQRHDLDDGLLVGRLGLLLELARCAGAGRPPPAARRRRRKRRCPARSRRACACVACTSVACCDRAAASAGDGRVGGLSKPATRSASSRLSWPSTPLARALARASGGLDVISRVSSARRRALRQPPACAMPPCGCPEPCAPYGCPPAPPCAPPCMRQRRRRLRPLRGAVTRAAIMAGASAGARRRGPRP